MKNKFKCPICGLHYLNKKLAKKCEEWCKNNKTCSLEISRYSLEAQEK